ncbi:MAG: TonB-dependent receptor plug domain-containing protein [Sphingomonas sp.]|uniref:TonB-dependent receptor plug domain-containing protein n=1 Tax=Sphingomonas sp. TaxID=28214 RepID=UPI003F803D6D
MLKLSILASSALAAIVIATPSWAQDAPQSSEAKADPSQDIVWADTKRDDIVVTATGVPQAVETIGQAITVIDRQTIEQRQTVALADLLATTPGVTVSRNGGLGGVTAVRIRGAEGEQTLTLIDGVRVNDPTSPGGAFDFANLLTGSIDRVEVLRGANSVPWGSQAIGGVVNVVTMQPEQGLQARANVEYGRYDSWFANGGISGSSGIVSGAFNAGYLRTDGFSAAAAGKEPDGYRQYGATGRLEVALASNVKLDLRGYYADSRVDIDGYPAPLYVLGDTPQYSATKEFYGYAGLSADFLGGRFHNRVAFTLADINRDNFAAPNTSPSSLFRGRSQRYEYQGDFRVTNAVRLVGGAEYEETRYADSTPLRATRNTTGLYGEVIVTPVDRLTATGGVRYVDDSKFGHHWVWDANAAYTLPTNTTLRASYAEGFKAPTLYQLNAPFYGNLDLKPETAESFDVGIEQKLLGNSIVASLTWFHRVTTSQIDFHSCTAGEIADATSRCYQQLFGGYYFNMDRTRAQGVEFALDVRPTDRLTLNASYSFIDAKDRTPGAATFDQPLLRRPRQSFSASIDWRTPIGLSVGATVQNVGATTDFDSYGSIVQLKNYALLGLRAEMPIGKRFSVYGRVDNLFDERYELAAEYGVPGRAVYGGIRLKFD